MLLTASLTESPKPDERKGRLKVKEITITKAVSERQIRPIRDRDNAKSKLSCHLDVGEDTNSRMAVACKG